jgi:hypothetical protein
MTILDETLGVLLKRSLTSASRITAMRLTPFFTVVEIDGAYLGASMSYYGLAREVQDQTESALMDRIPRDPLLTGWLLNGQRPDLPLGEQADQTVALETALRAAVTSALSAPWLLLGGDATFSVASVRPGDPFGAIERALVVGFGGYAPGLARARHIKRLDICDLAYSSHPDAMDRFAREHEMRQPGKVIHVSDGRDLPELMARADAVAITGSALSNGTMDDLLSHAPRGRPIIVQGQSGAIHPIALFRHGVTFVQTTLKPRALIDLAREDWTGNAMRGLLEGSRLPPLFMTPR